LLDSHQEKPTFPFIPGADAAGEVTELGAAVNRLKVGERVMALTGLGAFAKEVVVDAKRVLPIPDAMEFASAAAFPVAYGTSHGALEWRAHLQSGEWLLVTGAAGGMGLASQINAA
jgi:NADPH2:quinone reductase